MLIWKQLIINEKFINYENNYQYILTHEYEYLINHNKKKLNFCMNPKLLQSKELNKILKNQNS